MIENRETPERAYNRLASPMLGLAIVTLVRASVLYVQQRLQEAATMAQRAEYTFAHMGDEHRRISALYLRGSILFELRNFTETMVIVRSGDGDGAADHVFHMWARPALRVDGGFRNVGVDYTATSLSLLFADRNLALTFTVAGTPTCEIQIPESVSATGYSVTGLSHELGLGATRHTIRTSRATPFATCDLNCENAGWQEPNPWDAGN